MTASADETAGTDAGGTNVSVVRLRPIVHASPLPDGVHIRGWSSSFTVEGGSGLWKLWQVLARQFADGVPADLLVSPSGRPEVVRATELIVTQLREHDMLVEVPAGWAEPQLPGAPEPDLASWLESIAPDPAAAWQRLRGARIRIAGRGPVLEAAWRTFTAAGMAVHVEGGAAGTLLASAESGASVGARCDDAVGFVVAVGQIDEVSSALVAVARRLALASEPAGSEPPYPLAALVGAAAAHRLACAVAGLADPARQAATLSAAGPPPDDFPAVLVARVDPFTAAFHPWLPAASPATRPPRGPLPGGSEEEPGAAPAIDRALHGLDALTDSELGVLPAPVLGHLPQLPACIATAGEAIGVGVTADAARLNAVVAAAEMYLDRSAGRGAITVGTDRSNAYGVALRRRARAAMAALNTEPVAAREWENSPTARRWWKTLTLRLGVSAQAEVCRLHADVAYARILAGSSELAWAVEASPADAMAFAALAATGVVQARLAGVSVPSSAVLLTGAGPAWRPAQAEAAPWTDAHWYWPAEVSRAERRLRVALANAVPGAVRPVAGEADRELLRSLAAVGFHTLVDESARRVDDPRLATR